MYHLYGCREWFVATRDPRTNMATARKTEAERVPGCLNSTGESFPSSRDTSPWPCTAPTYEHLPKLQFHRAEFAMPLGECANCLITVDGVPTA